MQLWGPYPSMRSLLHSASVQWRAGCQSPPSPPGGPSCPCMLFVSNVTESSSTTAHLFKKIVISQIPTMQEENLLLNNIFYQLLFNNAMVQCTNNICGDKYTYNSVGFEQSVGEHNWCYGAVSNGLTLCFLLWERQPFKLTKRKKFELTNGQIISLRFLIELLLYKQGEKC